MPPSPICAQCCANRRIPFRCSASCTPHLKNDDPILAEETLPPRCREPNRADLRLDLANYLCARAAPIRRCRFFEKLAAEQPANLGALEALFDVQVPARTSRVRVARLDCAGRQARATSGNYMRLAELADGKLDAARAAFDVPRR